MVTKKWTATKSGVQPKRLAAKRRRAKVRRWTQAELDAAAEAAKRMKGAFTWE